MLLNETADSSQGKMCSIASGGFFADRKFLFPVAHAEIQEHQYAAYQPSCRIPECNWIDTGCYMGDDEQIDLAEYDERSQHDEHRYLCITHSAKRACVHLVHTAQNVEQTVQTDEESAVIHDLRVIAEE